MRKAKEDGDDDGRYWLSAGNASSLPDARMIILRTGITFPELIESPPGNVEPTASAEHGLGIDNARQSPEAIFDVENEIEPLERRMQQKSTTHHLFRSRWQLA